MERRKETDECRNIVHSIGTIKTNLKIKRERMQRADLPTCYNPVHSTMIRTQALDGQQVFAAFFEKC